MSQDIRVDVKLPGHRKYKALRRHIGESPMEYLICFWLAVATQCPTGQLIGWTCDDVEDAAGWAGEPGLLFSGLRAGFLDEIDGGYCPHDWGDHQPWVSAAPARSEAAKAAANARWERKHAERMLGASEAQCGSDAPSPSPSPIPKPNLKPKPKSVGKDVLNRLSDQYRAVCGLATMPPLKRFRDWMEQGKATEHDIETAILKVAGYPVPSRPRLIIDLIEAPRDSRSQQQDDISDEEYEALRGGG